MRRAYGELATQTGGEVQRFEGLEIDLTRMEVRRDGGAIDLTPIEYRLLRHLSAQVNVPVSRNGLLEAVWGYTSDVNSDRTVDVHIRHLRQKIERGSGQSYTDRGPCAASVTNFRDEALSFQLRFPATYP